jgi:Putative adhesin
MKALGTLTMVGVGLAALAAAQDNPQHVVAQFRDSAAPRKLEVTLAMANVTVRGTQRTDAAIDYTLRDGVAPRRNNQTPPPGMHRIGGSSAIDVIQDSNVVRVTGGMMGVRDVIIEVPVQTAVTIDSNLGGKIVVENIAGEIEINCLNGQIAIANASGPVVAHSTNGSITASLTRVAAGKNMSFSTFNGDIDITLPADAKATLKGRVDNGDIYTDFDVKEEPAAQALSAPPAPPLPPLPPAPSGSSNSNDIRNAVRDQVRAAVRNATRGKRADDYVEGTINGGGPEIQFTTFNGRILIHKK